jgi:signal transduction histidine kinase
MDVITSALLLTGGLDGLLSNDDGRHLPAHFALLVVALGLATLSLPFRHRFPLSVLVVVLICLVIGTLLKQGLAATPIVSLPIYSVATHLRRRDSLIAACLALLTFVVVTAIVGLHWSHGGGTGFYDATDNMLAIVVAWVIGDSLRARREFHAGSVLQAEQRLRFESERAKMSIAEERLHIARELHDIVAHSLSVIAIQSGVGRHVLDTQPEEARKSLAAIETTSRSALNDLRWVLGVLRNDDEVSESRNPAPGMADIGRLLEEYRAAGLDVSFGQSGEARPLSPSMDLCLYRIVQEALTNVTKHAGTVHATVDISYDVDAIVVSVLDEGALHRNGAVLAQDADGNNGSHHGLIGMRERTAIYGGTFVAGPRQGGGFEVRARLPISSDDS